MTVELGDAAWIVLPTAFVPPGWRHRTLPVSVIALPAEEAASLLQQESAAGAVAPADRTLVRLVVDGYGPDQIARRLGVTTRTVQRRLGRLREQFGVQSTAQLALALTSTPRVEPPAEGS